MKTEEVEPITSIFLKVYYYTNHWLRIIIMYKCKSDM